MGRINHYFPHVINAYTVGHKPVIFRRRVERLNFLTVVGGDKKLPCGYGLGIGSNPVFISGPRVKITKLNTNIDNCKCYAGARAYNGFFYFFTSVVASTFDKAEVGQSPTF